MAQRKEFCHFFCLKLEIFYRFLDETYRFLNGFGQHIIL